MLTEDKVIELFCIAVDFCKFFDAMMEKYTLKPTMKRTYHCASIMSKVEIMLIMILFNDSGSEPLLKPSMASSRTLPRWNTQGIKPLMILLSTS